MGWIVVAIVVGGILGEYSVHLLGEFNTGLISAAVGAIGGILTGKRIYK